MSESPKTDFQRAYMRLMGVPLRKRVQRAIGDFIWAYAPRVHFGPCPTAEGCHC